MPAFAVPLGPKWRIGELVGIRAPGTHPASCPYVAISHSKTFRLNLANCPTFLLQRYQPDSLFCPIYVRNTTSTETWFLPIKTQVSTGERLEERPFYFKRVLYFKKLNTTEKASLNALVSIKAVEKFSRDHKTLAKAREDQQSHNEQLTWVVPKVDFGSRFQNDNFESILLSLLLLGKERLKFRSKADIFFQVCECF